MRVRAEDQLRILQTDGDRRAVRMDQAGIARNALQHLVERGPECDLHAHGDTNSTLVRAELEEIRVVVNLEKSPEAPSYFTLLFGRDYRRRSALAMGLQCMQQVSGANIVVS